ncbi:MAG: hypothetical protein IJ814_03570 [Paludibacteraceae bacterium]|nr:hypothetical protein [Paludibacteraceae bacterium]
MCACANVPEMQPVISECSPMPGNGIASACAAVLDGKAYIFAGRDSAGNYTNSLWQYEAATDSWTKLSDCPGQTRVKAAIANCNGVLYIGLGHARSGVYTEDTYLYDWWRYTPEDDCWQALSKYERRSTIAPTTFVIGNRIYVIYGSTDCFTRDITYYDTTNDTWHFVADNHRRAKAVFCGIGAQTNGKTFFGLGNNTANQNQWFEMDLETDQWTRRSNLPAKGRAFSACSTSGNYIYAFGGRYFAGELTGGEVLADIYRYDTHDDQWTRCGTMPCGRAENQIAFTINGKVYFGLGENEKGRTINKLYCIE